MVYIGGIKEESGAPIFSTVVEIVPVKEYEATDHCWRR
jgi:hypothetical protein